MIHHTIRGATAAQNHTSSWIDAPKCTEEERALGVDLAVVREVLALWRWSGRRWHGPGGGGGGPEEQACDIHPTAVGEVVGGSPVWTLRPSRSRPCGPNGGRGGSW
jgi:hypothetical protein